MADKLSAERRSANMRAVRGRNTGPEILVRKVAHGLGFRFRLHKRGLPGTPDISFPVKRKAIFVHGCFWHQHRCKRGTRPQSNTGFWWPKLDRNVKRDANNLRSLKAAGWKVLVVWECQTVNVLRLADRVRRFLER